MTSENERLSNKTEDLGEFNKDLFLKTFPMCETEAGKVDFDRLKLLLGDSIESGKESFGMRWPGRNSAVKFANTPSTWTLLPNREKSVDFDTSKNIIIEGNNAAALKLLRKAYQGKIDLIYIDPPYNTGSDFVYQDDFTESVNHYLAQTGQLDSEGNRLSTNSESEGRFHSNWLNMMYPRLYLAWQLLSESGAIIISIDDHELTNLMQLARGLFGEQSFAGLLTWRKRTAKSDVPFGISRDTEYLLIYAKSQYSAGRKIERAYRTSPDYPGREWRLADLTKQTTIAERPNSNFTMIDPKTGNEYPVNPNRSWAITKDTFQEYYSRGKIVFPGEYDFLKIKRPAMRIFRDEERNVDGVGSVSTWLPPETVGRTEDGTKEIVDLFQGKPFPFPKPTNLLRYLLEVFGNSDDVVLDFFAGSGSTAHAVLAQNASDGGTRKFILVQLPEALESDSEAAQMGFRTIADITVERVKKVGQKILNEPNPAVDVSSIDLGFRLFQLSDSNIQDWESSDASASIENLLAELKEDRLKSDRSDEDVMFEVMVKYGVDLSSQIERVHLGNGFFWDVGNGELAIVTSKGLAKEDLHALAKRKPKAVVILDEAFEPEALKTNARATFKDAKIELKTF